MGEIPHPAVEFGQEHHGDEVEGRRVDQQRQGLPLGRRKPAGVCQGHHLRDQGFLGVNLGGDLHHPVHLLAGEGFHLSDVFLSQRMGEVEQDHHSISE
jgi:hypothetical protein